MLSSGIYLLQVQVRKIRNAIIAAGNYIITLRVGKNSTTFNFTRTGTDKQVQINARLQMNVDKSALQAQRCSLFITSEDKKMIGLALVSIPQETSTLSNTYKLTQNEDKRAQIQLKLKLSPFDGIRIQINRVKQQPIEANGNEKALYVNQAKDNNGLMSKIGLSKLDLLPSYINLKSNISDQASHVSSQQRPLKNFKLIEEQKMITVSESEIKRFKDEKQVYYQLYQIQKTKSQVALKFITAITKKLSNKYPTLAQQIEDSQPKLFVIEQRKNGRQNNHLHHQQSNQAHTQQLQQANRSLHRQVQQYKKIVEQLKEQLNRTASKGQHKKVSSISKQNKILPDFLDLSFSRGEKEKSPRRNRENPQQLSFTETLKGIDFKQWLQISIGERKALQKMFLSLQPHQNSAIALDVKALSTKIKQQLFQNMKNKIDKQFITLLKIKQISKQILINHRKQLNKLLQQCFLQ